MSLDAEQTNALDQLGALTDHWIRKFEALAHESVEPLFKELERLDRAELEMLAFGAIACASAAIQKIEGR